MGRSFFVVALVGLLLTGRAWSQECSQTIEGNDQIQFNKKEIKVAKSCKEFTLTLKHVGMLAANVMGHNWVLAKTSDYQALAQAGQGAGPPNYLPAGDARVIASTGVDRRRPRGLRKDRYVEADGGRRLHFLLLVPWTFRIDEREVHHRIRSTSSNEIELETWRWEIVAPLCLLFDTDV